MATIEEIVLKSMIRKKGFRAGSWRTSYKSGKVILSRYGTDILCINIINKKVLRATGFESSSDKSGVTKVLKALNISPSKVKKVEAQRGFRF